MGRSFFNGEKLMGEGLMRFIIWDLGSARKRRCGWDLQGFDGWEIEMEGV